MAFWGEREREREASGGKGRVDENERWGSQNFIGLDYFYMIIHRKQKKSTVCDLVFSEKIGLCI